MAPSLEEMPARAGGVCQSRRLAIAVRAFVERQFQFNAGMQAAVLERQAAYQKVGAGEAASYSEACVDIIAWQRGVEPQAAASWAAIWERDTHE